MKTPGVDCLQDSSIAVARNTGLCPDHRPTALFISFTFRAKWPFSEAVVGSSTHLPTAVLMRARSRSRLIWKDSTNIYIYIYILPFRLLAVGQRRNEVATFSNERVKTGVQDDVSA